MHRTNIFQHLKFLASIFFHVKLLCIYVMIKFYILDCFISNKRCNDMGMVDQIVQVIKIYACSKATVVLKWSISFKKKKKKKT